MKGPISSFLKTFSSCRRKPQYVVLLYYMIHIGANLVHYYLIIWSYINQTLRVREYFLPMKGWISGCFGLTHSFPTIISWQQLIIALSKRRGRLKRVLRRGSRITFPAVSFVPKKSDPTLKVKSDFHAIDTSSRKMA